MMTRKALSRQEESKLQLVLQELKASKELVEQLHRERDDNEKELLEVLDRNDKLKKEMAELHSQFIIIVDERDKLQIIVDEFGDCSDEYVKGLRRISILENELHDAHSQITHLEIEKQNITASQTQSLFDELISSAPNLVPTTTDILPTVTIDLTSDDSINCSITKGLIGCSRNKVKKYVKINRYIKKTQKLIKKQKCMFQKVKYIKERRKLGDELDAYSILLENNITDYESDILKLQSEIKCLHKSLKLMSKRYELTKKENEEHILALKNLIKEPVISGNIKLNDLHSQEPVSICESLSMQHCHISSLVNSNGSLNTSHVNQNIVMFSDDVGKDMGQLLSEKLGQPITNICMPGASYLNILERLLKYKFSPYTTILILIGNRGNMNKKDMIKYFDKMNKLDICKIILFTLPYCRSLPQVENNTRFKLNMTLDTLTFYNCNKFHVIDINSLMCNPLYLTRDKFYLNKSCKQKIASSLYFYFNFSAKNLANNTAFIEQSNDMHNQTLELIPNNLN